jgi:ATP-binding cassette subfamily B protein
MHPLTAMTQLSNTWANGLASAKRINEVLEAVPDVAEPETPEPLPEATPGGIAFEAVGFHYDGASDEPVQPVLEAISARAEPGKTLAILGATGSGKSSLVNLIPRFYDACAGSVSIDGADVRRIGQDSLLRHIAVVPQETILFTGTVRDNIRYGKPGAGEDEVIAAAKAAQAHDFILSLPQGYDTRVEERGRNLSGGQRQRVAIARALIQKPSILILDDSTSAVDVETETKIQDAIRERMSAAGASAAGASAAGASVATCVVVAQRISTVLNADKILVLDEGRVVAEGTHRQLLRSSPVYREIYDSQLGGGLKAARPSEGGRHGL